MADMRARSVTAAFVVLVASCSSGDGAEPTRACVPGQTQACVGQGACIGGQACNADGSGWGGCLCADGGSDAGEVGPIEDDAQAGDDGGSGADDGQPWDGDALDAAPIVPDRLPTRPDGLAQSPSGTGKALTLAMKVAYLGTRTRAGLAVDGAWREWGYDLDGRCTDLADSTGTAHTCQRVAGSNANVLVDGDRCRDNNFASQFVALLASYAKNLESNTNASLGGGSRTLALVLSDLDPGDDGYVPGALYRIAAMPVGSAPTWDGSDVRSVTDDSVSGGDLSKPIVRFPNGYIAGNVWVSGEPSSFSLSIGLLGAPLVLPIQSGHITIPLDAARATSPQPALVVGAVATAELQKATKPIAEAAGLCPTGPSSVFYDGMMSTVLTLPDVVLGAPSLQDTTVTCDAVSTAIGFDLVPIRPLSAVVPAPAPAPSKCP